MRYVNIQIIQSLLGSVMNIGEREPEQKRLENSLKSNDEMALDIFKPTQVNIHCLSAGRH